MKLKFKIFNTKDNKQSVKSTDIRKFVIYRTELKRNSDDMDAYWKAVQAVNSDMMPSNGELIRLHNRALLDSHVQAVITKRRMAATQTEWECVDSEDNVLDEYQSHMNSRGFSETVGAVFDSILHGFTLIQYDTTTRRPYVVPRQNVKWQTGSVIADANNQSAQGEPFDTYPNHILFQHSRLGILTPVCRIEIMKRNALGDFCDYMQRYAMPISVVTTAGNDAAQAKSVAESVNNAGSDPTIALPSGYVENLELKSGSNSSTNDLYTKGLEFFNAEISKAVLGQTMTTDDGGSYSQAAVHLTVEGRINSDDLRYIEDELNAQYLPIAVALGWLPNGCKLRPKSTDNRSLDEQLDSDNKLITLVPSIDRSFFASKYNVPVTDTGTPYAVVLGVGGTQAFISIIADQTLAPEQKKQSLILLFGLKEQEADKLINIQSV